MPRSLSTGGNLALPFRKSQNAPRTHSPQKTYVKLCFLAVVVEGWRDLKPTEVERWWRCSLARMVPCALR